MPRPLTEQVEFECPFRVHPDGTVTNATGVYAPDLLNGEIYEGPWELLNGYSGQNGYSGPIMHNSEYIGGQMERDILSAPGVYVAIACYWDAETAAGEMTIEGWAVAKYTGDDNTTNEHTTTEGTNE